jgi:hypothetical protein
MYLHNKYTQYYYSIINAARARTLPSNYYTEKHHIVPKCLGGSDIKDNIAKLTAREHFICHRLLPKMTNGPKRHKLIYALNRMLSNNQKQKKIFPIEPHIVTYSSKAEACLALNISLYKLNKLILNPTAV